MYGYSRTHRTYLAALAGLCFALFSVSSLAVTIDLGPSDFRTFGPNGTHYGAGIRTMRGQPLGGIINTLPRPMNLPATVNRPSVVPYGSVAQGMKNFVRVNPASVAASAAVTGLFLAVDWVFDQATGEWVKQDYFETEHSGVSWNVPGCSNVFESTATAACETASALQCHSAFGPLDHVKADSGTRGAVCVFERNGRPGQFWNAGTFPQGECIEGQWRVVDDVPGCYEYGNAPLEESDWSELESFLPSANPGSVSSAAGDTMRRIGNPLPGYEDLTIEGPPSLSGPTTTSTTTNPSTGQSTVTEQQTVTRFAYSPDSITVTETTTSTNYNPDGSVESETVTETTPGEEVITPPSTGTGTATGEWPSFCSWATVVCEWFNWTQEGWDGEEPELPQIIDFEPESDFQVGGPGDCPAPYILNLGWKLNQSIEVSYQPFCDLGVLIKPLFLAFCYLFAGVITVRSI